MTQAIFLSYASQDADAARRICDALRAAGLQVWFDQSELRGGDAWDASIRKQIKECVLFVPIISASTQVREEGYFRLEWKLAVDRSHLMADDKTYFMPVVIDDTAEPAARVPDKFRERQWSRLQDDNAITTFAARIAKLLDGSGVSGTNAPNTAPTLVKAASPAGATPHAADEGFWVAVLPFKYRGSHADLPALAEGISEEIVTGLARFSYLRVIARGATLQLTGEAVDVRAVGRELGARYVMEGSLRQAGATLRVSVQLVDARSGAHLWAETYDRPFKPEDIFALQDDLVPRIVSTVADCYGVLPHSMSEAVRNRPLDQLTPYEALLRSFGSYERVTADEHADARSSLERAVQQAPNNGVCWAMLSSMYVNEYGFGFNVLPDSLGRALTAAKRAVAAAPTSHLAYQALAWATFFQKDFEAARNAAERAMKLNPMDGSNIAIMGVALTYIGDWERGCALIEQGAALNPNHPSWYWMPSAFNAYRKRDYRAALDAAVKTNLPGWINMRVIIAACYGQLGDQEAACKALLKLHPERPDFSASTQNWLAKWFDAELIKHLFEGLQKAGLEMPLKNAVPTSTPVAAAIAPAETSMAKRADEGFWVAVLPFKHSGTDESIHALAEGLSEEIVTGLSRFSYLRVIARSATLHYAGKAADARAVGKALGARYVMEGTVRQAGTTLRVAVQLIDAETGANLWAETYARAFKAADIFALQDDLVPRIVSTVADSYGVLPHSMSATLRGRAPDQLTPYQALLRSFGYLERATAEEHAVARACLEYAVEKAPDNADCWASLATMYLHEHHVGFNARPDPLGRALRAAQHAIAAGPSNHLAYNALAWALHFRMEFPASRNAAERTLALNPMDGSTSARMGMLIAYSGDWETGCAILDRARQLNPNHPGWYWFAPCVNAYRQHDYRGAIDIVQKINMPGYYYVNALLVIALAQIGDRDATAKALRELLVLRPDVAAVARTDFSKWGYSQQLVEHLLDGMRKAGLAIPDATDSVVGAG